MSLFRRRRREVPGLNTASLPDLIFTVLFFFMIVTHMKEVTLKVRYRVPQGSGLSRLARKSAVVYVYIGRPAGRDDGPTRIQVDDRYVTPEALTDYLVARKRSMPPEDAARLVVSIKADRHTKMGVINDVKQALRRAKILKISYSATEKSENNLSK